MNKLTTTLCVVAVAASAIVPVAGATTVAEHLVPRSEYNKYSLVYTLTKFKHNGHGGTYNMPLVYDVDNSTKIPKGGFSRVAYYFETKATGGEVNWVWVSLDAFTDDPAKLGLPTRRSGAVFQRRVLL